MTETTPREAGAPDPAPKTSLDIHDILKILPHRYPLLLIDRVLESYPSKEIIDNPVIEAQHQPDDAIHLPILHHNRWPWRLRVHRSYHVASALRDGNEFSRKSMRIETQQDFNV